MVVGLLTLRLKIGYAESLKDKRRVVKSLINKIRNQFNVSISEVDDLESWHHAKIGVAFVTNDNAYAHQVLNRIVSYLDCNPEFELISIDKELI